MKSFVRLFHDQTGMTKVGLVLAAAIVAYLALAGSWAAAIFETIDRLGARLPL